MWLSGMGGCFNFSFFGFSNAGFCVRVCHTYTLVQFSANGSNSSFVVKYFSISLSWKLVHNIVFIIQAFARASSAYMTVFAVKSLAKPMSFKKQNISMPSIIERFSSESVPDRTVKVTFELII